MSEIKAKGESKEIINKKNEEAVRLRHLQRRRDQAKSMADFVAAQRDLDEFFALCPPEHSKENATKQVPARGAVA